MRLFPWRHWLRWRAFLLTLSVLFGILGGLGGFTFVYAKGFSYFSRDAESCVNCHIMREQYDSWRKSSHHAAAVCVDCHLPQSLIPNLIAKSENGFRHSKGFTLQDFHEPIMITPGNAEILQANCIRCHEDYVYSVVERGHRDVAKISCVHCHTAAGHGPRR